MHSGRNRAPLGRELKAAYANSDRMIPCFTMILIHPQYQLHFKLRLDNSKTPALIRFVAADASPIFPTYEAFHFLYFTGTFDADFEK